MSKQKLSRRALIRRTILRVGAGAIAVGLAEGLRETHHLSVVEHVVDVPFLPDALDGLRVAQLTDLHRGKHTPDDILQKTVQATRELAPDLVLLTGDFIHGTLTDANVMGEFLAALSPRLGMWAVTGNHDYADSADLVHRIVAHKCGANFLRNEATELVDGLWLSGIDDTVRGTPDPKRALKAVPQDRALLFLTHNPVGVRFVSDRACVAFSGHTHGGQVRIPGVGLYKPEGMDGFSQVDGWGKYDRARLYVSRGIGNSGLAVRFDCLPELTLFTLRKAAA